MSAAEKKEADVIEMTKSKRTVKCQSSVFARGDHVEIGERLITKCGESGRVIADEGSLYKYGSASGQWHTIARPELSRTVQSFAGAPVGEKAKPLKLRASDIAGAIDLAHAQVADPGFFHDAPNGLAFANGFVRVDASGVHMGPHSYENRARAGYPFAFDIDAPRSQWLDCLSEIFRNDDDAKERIELLQEFFGGALIGVSTKFAVALVLFGPGNDGKSTIQKVACAAMPEGTTAAIAPQLWGSEYRRAQLRGIRLNAVNELPENEILNSDSFKAIVTGDPIDARDIREAPFTLYPVAGHILACNKLPGVVDQTHGFWRRLCALHCTRKFDELEADVDRPQTIIEHERAGVVAWMLEGAARLLERGRYILPPSSTAAIAEWKRGANPVAIFREERLMRALNDSERTDVANVYEAFGAWCTENGFTRCNSRNFGVRLSAIGFPSEKSTHGKRVYRVRFRRSNEEGDANVG